jgi:hypothetical protein
MTKKKFHGSRKRNEFKAQGERRAETPKRTDHPFTLAIAATPTERLKSGANSALANGDSSARRDLRHTNATKSPLSKHHRSFSIDLARSRRCHRDYGTLVRLHLASVSNRFGC